MNELLAWQLVRVVHLERLEMHLNPRVFDLALIGTFEVFPVSLFQLLAIDVGFLTHDPAKLLLAPWQRFPYRSSAGERHPSKVSLPEVVVLNLPQLID